MNNSFNTSNSRFKPLKYIKGSNIHIKVIEALYGLKNAKNKAF